MSGLPPRAERHSTIDRQSLWLVEAWERGRQALPYLPIPLLVIAMVFAAVAGALIPDFGLIVPAGIIGGIIAAAAFLRPPLGLFLFAFMLYSRLSENLTTFVNVPSIAPIFAVFLLTGLIAREGLGSLFRSRRRYWQPIAAYGLVMLASVFVAVNQQAATQTITDLVKDLVFVLVVILYARRYVDVRVLIWAMLSAGFVASCLTVYQAISGNDFTFFGLAQTSAAIVVPGEIEEVPRPSGYVGDPNFYALSLLPLVPLALHRARYELHRGMRWFAGLVALLLPIAIFMTYSRGAYLALLVVLIGLVSFGFVKLRTIGIAALIFVLLLPVLPEEYSGRLSTIGDATGAVFGSDAPSGGEPADTSVSGRIAEVLAGVYMFTDHPLLGVGVSNYPEYYQEYARPLGIRTRAQRNAHSLLVEVAAETGVLGLATFLVLVTLLFLWLRAVMTSEEQSPELRDLARVLIVALAGFMAASMFLHAAYPRFFWVLVALIIVVHSQAFTRLEGRLMPRLGMVRPLSPVVTPMGRHRARLALGVVATTSVAAIAVLLVNQQLAARDYPLLSRGSTSALALSPADFQAEFLNDGVPATVTVPSVATGIGRPDIAVTAAQLAPAAAPATAIEGCQFFTETSHNLCGVFGEFWTTNGGLLIFGYPLSEELMVDGVRVQYFERARFEVEPDPNTGAERVALSSLGARGLTAEQPRSVADPALPIEQDDCMFEDATQHNVCGSFAYFWLTYGGVEAFGYPISEEITLGASRVQYFQNARFEERPDGSDASYGIMLAPLGRQELERILPR